MFRALSPFPPEAALVAALLVAGCAGADAQARGEVEVLRAELGQVRQENQALQRTLEGLAARVDLLTARLGRGAEPAAARPAGAGLPEPATLVPQGLEVVKMGPPPAERQAPAGLAVIKVEPSRAERPARRPPPVPTAVPIQEPDPSRLEALGRRGGRELSAEAEAELKAARRAAGLDRAHALEDFVGRYPHHPQAAAALVEAGDAYAESGRDAAACTLARRALEEYPAGRAIGDAMERLATCEARAGDADAEKKVLTRLVTQFPGTPAARRAGDRLAAISGGTDGDSPAGTPERSGP
ncbi:MAG: tetratricopeptide repeat protein [Anaeromyxobacter sp.]|nr:tetratricopeptide repeat protein [Anaeromyxobacter sp.]MBL0278652.1 tetratricopeptide repeat protein [Anaeromyxobacter sp.]